MRPEKGTRPPQGAFKLADRLARESIVEMREFQRHKLTVEVEVHPLNKKFEPVGEGFVAVTQDISTGGLGFIHTRAVNDKLLCISLSEEMWQAHLGQVFVLEVKRCDPVGSLYAVGGRFIGKIDDPRESAKQGSKISARPRKRRTRVELDTTTPIATDTELQRQLRPADHSLIPGNCSARTAEEAGHTTDRATNWLIGGLILVGVIGGACCCLLKSVVNNSKANTLSFNQAIHQAKDEIPLDLSEPAKDQRPQPAVAQSVARAANQPNQLTATVLTEIQPLNAPDFAPLMPLDKAAGLSPRKPLRRAEDPERAQKLQSLLPVETESPTTLTAAELAQVSEDEAARAPADAESSSLGDESTSLERLGENADFGKPLELKRAVPSEKESKHRDPQRARTRAELESMYTMYAEMKGWVNDKKTVRAKVDSWQQRNRGSVGLALKFFKTGVDGAKRTGRNAEVVYKTMPPEYWPYPAR